MTITLPVPPDFSFHETLHAHGWSALLPFARFQEPLSLERVERMNDGEVVLLQIRAEGDSLLVSITGDADETEIAAKVRRMLQLDLPLDGFHAFCLERPELAHIPARCQGRMLVSPTVWEDTVKVICTTNTTWAQTKAMVARLVNSYGSPGPFDSIRHAFPTPAQIAAIPFDDFAATAKLGYRNAAVHSLAVTLAEGRMDLEQWRVLETQALWRRLLELRGVGPYAASCLLLYLGRPERVNVDSWARMLLSKELGRPVKDNEVQDFFEHYGRWRGLVYNFYPWKQG